MYRNRLITTPPRLTPMQTGTFATTHTRADASSLASQLHQPGSQQATTAMNSYTGGPNAIQDATQHFTDEGVMPDINVLRQNPRFSQTVSQILSAYDSQARQDSLLEKPTHVKKSGRFNTTDTVTAVPELRWPNEGF